ncbi:hypothetical protein AC249_AIPGENE14015 [Exaiptasia diaphana]|nr:hypothetical protein AC249_AIPGENE14015 [Exaiptasia diaphana]
MEDIKKLRKEDFFPAVAFAWACQLTLPTPYQCDEHEPPSDNDFDSADGSSDTTDASEASQVTESQDETLSSIDKNTTK